ncbi:MULTISPECIES: TetR/AcrR family transcriptional regulator [unclassified Mycobacterium]|uniref:TetR/AcrR family transcriptional regulator n=1 Tax=unclassified Mycobacterium TaxID=2642494 RepID=UPI0007401771|nr:MULTISPECIES: TetR/AcrR family transcriptional regulator [unclassified Mycobacterium]KUH85567.1 TetR family transcriptional regulator [Mycobacterium sp. GA-1999]KUH91425.1 TetR family transcriptional regulator [Mycobacterium sp. GA-0227b]KUH96321.1 TetR family transcriptional regulator [Mycobacterium sp. IS-1556]
MAYVKAAEREEQIVAAARRVLAAVGVSATTLRAVAAEAGIALGTLHYVFPSKEKMLQAVIAAVVGEVVDTVAVDLELDRGVEHAIRQGALRFWDALVEGDVGVQIMQYELAMYSARTKAAGGLALYEQYTSLITELCEQAARSAGERCSIDFHTLGRLCLAVVDGLIVQYVANPDPDRAHRDLNRALDMIVAFADPQPVTKRAKRRG